MARPVKEGLDYYPKNTDYFNDRKVRKLLKEFGCKGYVIFDYLLCVIYQDKGYYVVYDDDLAFDVADVLDNGITESLVNEVVNGCVRIGLFNRRLFDSSNILTSSGIQKRYVLVKKTRVINERIRVNESETPVNCEISTQRKEKESKGNERTIMELKIEDCKLPPEDIGYKVIDSSIRLFQGFMKHFPKNKDLPKTLVGDWVPPVRALMEKKEYTYDQIADVLNWTMSDPFWKKIIIDTVSLEKNFEKLKIHYQNA